MRRIVKVSGFLFLTFLFFPTQAQFNLSSLFTPIDFRIPLRLYQNDLSDGEISTDASLALGRVTGYLDSLNGWQNWSFVENYYFGKNRGTLPMITDLNSLHPFFRDQIIKLIEKCKAKGIELAVVETYRTPSKQREYKTMGRKYTNSSAGRSRHQYGLAVDVVPVVDSVAVWDNTSLWRKIGLIGEKIGLRWGGRWRNPYDPGHFEWTGGLTSYHLAAGRFPSLPIFAERYPCLEEDIRMLRRYWSEWETYQSAMAHK